MVLGDLVVLWRALVLWPARRAVQVISAILVTATLGTFKGADSVLLGSDASIYDRHAWMDNGWRLRASELL